MLDNGLNQDNCQAANSGYPGGHRRGIETNRCTERDPVDAENSNWIAHQDF